MTCQIFAEILEKILENLEDDKNTLFSCMLVNRYWCKLAVRILWSKPFHLSYSPKLVRSYLPFFPPDSKVTIGLNHSFQPFQKSNPPLFDYPSFIRRISVYYMCCGIRSFILDIQFRDQGDSKQRRYTDAEWILFTRQTQNLSRELFKLFLTRSPNILSLNLAMQERDFCLRENPNKFLALDRYKSAKFALSKLRQFSSGGEGKKFYEILSKFCHNIKSFNIIYNFGDYCKFENLIKSQKNLEHLQIHHMSSLKEILNSLESQFMSLRTLEFWDCVFTDTSLDYVSKCFKLERIIFHYCSNLTAELLYPLSLAKFQNIKTIYFRFKERLDHKDRPIDELANLIEISNSTLSDLYIQGIGYPSIRIFQAIVNCKNLQKLSIQIQILGEFPLLLHIMKSCKKLHSISVQENPKFFVENFFLPPTSSGSIGNSMDSYLDANEFFPQISQILNEDVNHLVLNLPNCWITPETLRLFLNNCKANLEYLRWQSFHNIQLFVEIVEEYGRKMGKEIKYGNWKWEQFRDNVASKKTRLAVLNAYKYLLKTQKETFNGDFLAISEARRKTREEFLKNKNETDEIEINNQVNQALEAAEFIKSNVIQAVFDEKANRFKAKITENTELGDNESIKNPLSIKELKEKMKCES
ncbi:24760_t:CDS:2 [Dentiscutata erythropus]|uniref:Mitochondrial zinc maintenance protein 1, mitochondrial n=1 Tax=Dentiscutata erythropus TaxID=1348616 RepID=A0A9N8VAP5_9GLOM|nr:24760_t:CDS:2 [Dentiscutata erythropus]